MSSYDCPHCRGKGWLLDHIEGSNAYAPLACHETACIATRRLDLELEKERTAFLCFMTTRLSKSPVAEFK